MNLTTDYLLKDILQSDLVKSPELIKRLLLLLAYQVGSEVSQSELANNLGVSRQTVMKYLDLLERTFVIFRLPSFSTNLRKEIAKSQKIYFWDTGVKNAIQKEFTVSGYRSDIGALWENWVIAEYAKRNAISGQPADLYFWRGRDSGEIDLVIKTGSALKAIEIKWNQRTVKSHRSFERRYGTKTKLVSKQNFVEMLVA